MSGFMPKSNECTPRNPEAYYRHPLAKEIAVAARNGRYITLEGAFDIGRVVEEVVESEWLAEHSRQVAEKAWEEGRNAGERIAGDGVAALLTGLEGPQPEGNPYRKEQDDA